MSNLFAFSGITYLYIIPPFLKDNSELKKVSIISIIISSLYLFFSVTCLLLVFPFITTTEESFSIYLITRLMEYGRFFQRIDAIFILIWISSALSYLSISLFFVSYIFKKVTNISNQKSMIYCFSSIIVGLALIPRHNIDLNFISNTIYKYFFIGLIFIITPLILILANIKKNKENLITKR